MPIPRHPQYGENLSNLDRKGDAFDGQFSAVTPDREIFHLEKCLLGLDGFLAHLQNDLPADHHTGQFRTDDAVLFPNFLRSHRAHDLPPAQHGNVVGNLQDLFELVSNEDDGSPLLLYFSHGREESFDFLRREDRSGFVHDENVHLSKKHAQDLNPLLLPYG